MKSKNELFKRYGHSDFFGGVILNPRPLKIVRQPFHAIKRGKLFGGTVPPNNTLFGGTVPPNNTLFGGTVPPNSTLFGGTPDSER